MAKIMLVEDDNNLREIYEARLLAEGHEIVSAHDGEEALALAVREKPELIISDVMMPKISGFDMLDILRGSPDTKDTKVIMMTALSQMDDKDRADRLGADRYLVKSQVTLEDVVRVAREVLEGTPPADPTATVPVATEPIPVAAPAPAVPVAPTMPTPTPTPMPVAEPPAPVAPVIPVAPAPTIPSPDPTPSVTDPTATVAAAQTTATEQATVNDQIANFTPPTAVGTPDPVAAPAPVTPQPVADTPAPDPTSGGGTKVIQPLNEIEAKPDLNALLAQEEEKEKMNAAVNTNPPTNTPPTGSNPGMTAL